MRVECIQSTKPIGTDPRTILAFKGSVYTVIKEYNKPLFGYPTTKWYEFLETGLTVHMAKCFRPITDEEEGIEHEEICELIKEN